MFGTLFEPVFGRAFATMVDAMVDVECDVMSLLLGQLPPPSPQLPPQPLSPPRRHLGAPSPPPLKTLKTQRASLVDRV